jgi:hypothetical protein
MERNGSIPMSRNGPVPVFGSGKNEERNGSVPMFGSGKNAERNGRILVQLTSFMLMVNIPPPCNNIVIKKLAALCLYFQQFAITNIFI